ncbi:MAG: CDP-alcohol phosphatidyltransferase family protein [Candidatus Marinimicrobia bacterium]|nr:CDP-alcohol phosphatidyltransferase family protein [Candidatus Neomarinimicrobiota bacterium]
MNFLLRLNVFSKKIIEKKDEMLIPLIQNYWPRWLTPNLLTASRIGLAGVIALMFFDYTKWYWWIMTLFVIGMATDFLDGLVARALDMKSKLGKALDPLADKLFVVPVLFFILKDHLVLLVCIVCCESILVSTALLIMMFGRDPSSNHYGKWKFTFQTMSVFLFLVFGANEWIILMLEGAVVLAVLSIAGHLEALFPNGLNIKWTKKK